MSGSMRGGELATELACGTYFCSSPPPFSLCVGSLGPSLFFLFVSLCPTQWNRILSDSIRFDSIERNQKTKNV